MGRRLLELLRRLDRWQHGRGAKIACSIAAFVLVAAAFWPLHREASRLDRLEASIVELLKDANLAERDAAAVELFEQGTVTVDGKAYGDGRFRGADQLFDEAGALLAAASVGEIVVADEIPAWAPSFLVQSPSSSLSWATLVLAWLLVAVWAVTSLQLVLAVLATVALASPFVLFGKVGAIFAIGGMGLLGFSFVLLVRLVIAGVSGLGQPGAVAATVIREAVRQKAFAGFIVLLLVVLPLIPLWIDPTTPLRYQLQVFIGRSLGITYAVAACMTLVLACATVAFEIRDRQILQLMTKPLARSRYLLGKWSGIVLLDAVLLAVCGLSIFLFIQYLKTRPAADAFDAQAVRDEVLVARVGIEPQYDLLPRARLLEMIDEAIENDPMLRDEISQGERDEYEVRRELFAEYQKENLAAQRSIAPGDEKIYRFPGLAAARRLGANLTLRYKFYAGESDPHVQYPVIFRFPEDGTWTDRRYVPAQSMVLVIPADLIGEDGGLDVGIANAAFNPNAAPGTAAVFPAEHTIFFDPEGLELLYPVSSFEANFLRGMLVTLVKLSFLAMLGVAMASLLSFPVACLVGFAVFLAAEAGPFLAQSIGSYRIYEDDGSVDWVKQGIRSIAVGTEWVLRAFGQTRPNPALVEGREVSWGDVFRSLGVIGLGWSAAVLVIAMLVFRRKELAVYSGQTS